MKDGQWQRKKFMGVEIRNKSLGVVGLGRIGRHVVEMASGLGFRVLAFDPFVAPTMAEQLNVELIQDLEELASRVEFMTVHVPLLPQTRGLIGEKVFSSARPGMRLVNCARGGIVDCNRLRTTAQWQAARRNCCRNAPGRCTRNILPWRCAGRWRDGARHRIDHSGRCVGRTG